MNTDVTTYSGLLVVGVRMFGGVVLLFKVRWAMSSVLSMPRPTNHSYGKLVILVLKNVAGFLKWVPSVKVKGSTRFRTVQRCHLSPPAKVLFLGILNPYFIHYYVRKAVTTIEIIFDYGSFCT